ncbi:MAG: hypothetical protein JXA14_10520 [Anaerolineae bacterium]|nr:hypothetical protein [Anaerolineae bacterium]
MSSRILREDGELIYLPDAAENRNILSEAGEDVGLARIYTQLGLQARAIWLS